MDTKKDIIIRGMLNEDDLKTFSNFNIRKRFTKIFFLLLIVCLIMFPGIADEEGVGMSRGMSYTIALAIPIVVMSLVIMLTNIVSRNEHKNNPLTKYAQVYTIDEYGIIVQNQSGSRLYRWQGFSKKIEYKGYFFLYIAPSIAIILPERFFTDKSEILHLKKLIK